MMADTKFTPGPWEQDPSDECAIMSENGAIATVLTGHDFPCLDDYEQLAVIPECEANARLIAAAPELYEALAELVECNIKRGPFDEPLCSSEQTAEINAAVSAIKQARGEQ